MKRMFTVKPKHWWQWLSPAFYRRRKITQAFVDAYQEEIIRLMNERISNAIFFGQSIPLIKWDENGQLGQVDDTETNQD